MDADSVGKALVVFIYAACKVVSGRENAVFPAPIDCARVKANRLAGVWFRCRNCSRLALGCRFDTGNLAAGNLQQIHINGIRRDGYPFARIGFGVNNHSRNHIFGVPG